VPLIVTITKTYGSREEIRSEHNTDDRADAIKEAVQKVYGDDAYFRRDLALFNFGYYGQVFRNLPDGENAEPLTGRVKITFEESE
jgi:hypothetical protein